ncbi:nonstructural protein [Tortoise microvirus 27]|nr:nonstructural protein [Tortoise microvirus 27]
MSDNKKTSPEQTASNDITYLYTIYDVVADHYLPVFECRLDVVAQREFRTTMQKSYEQNMVFDPEDFRLFRIGWIDRSEGLVLNEEPGIDITPQKAQQNPVGGASHAK